MARQVAIFLRLPRRSIAKNVRGFRGQRRDWRREQILKTHINEREAVNFGALETAAADRRGKFLFDPKKSNETWAIISFYRRRLIFTLVKENPTGPVVFLRPRNSQKSRVFPPNLT